MWGSSGRRRADARRSHHVFLGSIVAIVLIIGQAGTSVAQASPGVDLDQWANGGKNQGQSWVNGDLNQNDAAYREGDVVPFRLAIEGLNAGSHTIHINYDFTAGGVEAYDFLATWDDTETPSLCASGGGAVSSMCPSLPAPDTKPFPSDSFAPGSPTHSGLTVAGAEAFSGRARALTMYGGTITTITGPTHSGPASGNSTGDFTVTFNATGSAVLFAWGGHLAESAYWVTTNDNPNGAAQISGAPWHMRTQNLDGSGSKNQDRSIQPSAIVALPGLNIVKKADAASVTAGNIIGFTITVSNTGNVGLKNVAVNDPLPDGNGVDWSIATQSDAGLCTISGSAPSQSLSCGPTTLAAGDSFSVHITSPTSDTACVTYDNTATASADGVPDSSSSDSVTLTDCPAAPQLTVIKHVINDDGGTAVAGDFTMNVTATNPSDATFPGAESPGTTITLDPGSYSVDESGGPAGYTASFSAHCSGTIAAGETKTCTVTNDDIPPPPPEQARLTVIKHVINDDGGTAVAGDFTMNVTATNPSDATFPGAESPGTTITLDPGSYSVDESGGPAGYTKKLSAGCSGTLAAGDSATCTITNDDLAQGGGGGGGSGSPALAITKTADAQTVLAGAPIGFTVTVSSTGSATATGVSLSDPLPTGSGISWSIAGGSGAAQCSISGNTLSCGFGDMAAGTSKSVHVTSPTTTDSCGSYVNTATASSTNAASVQASASTSVACPAIRVVKSAHPDHGSPGDTITYRYVVTNVGTVDLFDISVDDDVLGHICDIPLLHPGESQTCTKDYVIPDNANISIKNVVVAKGHDAEGNEVQDHDRAVIDVILGATVTPTPTKTPTAGLAFTGTSAAIPLGGIALLLLLVGTALMWLGRRGRRPTTG